LKIDSSELNLLEYNSSLIQPNIFNFSEEQIDQNNNDEVIVKIDTNHPASSTFSNMKVDTSKLYLLEYTSSLKQRKIDLIGMGFSKKECHSFFSPNENMKSDVITTLFPLYVTNLLPIKKKTSLAPPLISYLKMKLKKSTN
jgi:hypothetical protein